LGEGSQGAERLTSAGLPTYTFPEEIAYVFNRMGRYRAWRQRPERIVVKTPSHVETARTTLEEQARLERSEILGADALSLLQQSGIPTAALSYSDSQARAVELAEETGYPVVLKLDADGLVHKTEIGGVITDVRNANEVLEHYDRLMERAAQHNLSNPAVLVQPMVKGGVEMAIGMVRDPQFGPLVMCGLGGVYVEVVKDTAFRLPPVTEDDAREMIEGLKGYKLLTGYRGAPPSDQQPLIDALVTVSQMVSGFPLIQELDINPFVVCPKGKPSRAIDARIILVSPAKVAHVETAAVPTSA